MLRPLLLLSVVSLLGACAGRSVAPTASTSESLPAVQVVTAGDVSHCTALPVVVGSNVQPAAAQNGLLAAQSFGTARSVAMDKARAEGATHLVWADEIVGAAGSFITARPYRCDRVASN